MIQEGDHVRVIKPGKWFGMNGLVTEVRGSTVKVLVGGGEHRFTHDDLERR